MILYGLNKNQLIPTAKAQREKGKEARKTIPFSAQATLSPVNRDLVALIESQNTNRLPDLIDLRRERMSTSPFTFYRGSALLMAHDLSKQPITGHQLIICGDAHLNNFGLYASPERRLVFDLNDFDEAAPGPWEWDLKRLVTSVILCGEDLQLRSDQIQDAALVTAHHYRTGLRDILKLSSLDRYYVSIDDEKLLKDMPKSTKSSFEKITKNAKRRTSTQVIDKFTQADAYGRQLFVEDPPVLTHLEPELVHQVEDAFEQYKKTVRPDIALLLSQHILTDAARRVVGVGSVGTRCYVLALTCENASHLVLQIKEANPSVISRYSQTNFSTPHPITAITNQGYRVAKYQQILQAVSDPFLGHFQANGRDFYVRQFRDMKGSIEVAALTDDGFKRYAAHCGFLLARAHAQSPNANWVAGYMGKSPLFDQMIVNWCYAYTKQIYRDYEKFIKR